MAMTPLPDPPSRQDPDTFAAKSDALLGALPAFVTEANALQVDVTASKDAAALSAGAAATAVAGIDAQIAIAAGHAADAADQVVLAAAQVDLAEAQVALAAGHANDAAGSASDAAASLAVAILTERLNLGAKAANPTVDNQGNPLLVGALYYNTVDEATRVWSGSVWKAAGSTVNGTSQRYTYTATAGQTTFAAVYDPGYVDVYLNGIKLVSGTDFTATSSTNVVLSAGAAVGDTVDIVGYGTFVAANHYSKAESDSLLSAEVATLNSSLATAVADINSDLSTLATSLAAAAEESILFYAGL